MRIAGESIGRRGAAALSATAVVAALLAIQGYSHPGSLLVAGGLTPTSHASPTSSASGAQPHSSPSASVSPSASPSGATTLGPLLSSTSYAGYTYQLYPGTPSVSARQALSGFTFTAQPSQGSVTFTLSFSGGGQPPITKTYPASDHIYFIEASLGDDSGNAEYNFGDDGYVATDASGHVVQ